MTENEQKPERDEFELEPETVVDLEPTHEEAEEIGGGGLNTKCYGGSVMQRL